jgi:two-component system response regulator PilR (NtrC family)
MFASTERSGGEAPCARKIAPNSKGACPEARRPFSPTGEADPFHDALLPGLSELEEQIRRVAPLESTLLLTGETGTGKTRLARLIHELSPRRDEPFLVVDCGALSGSLIESELFGHTRGAFTGADRDRVGKLSAAGRGTLLLDEVNSLPPALQGKLLRAVDERVFEPVGSEKPQPFLARLIAASNVPLEREVEASRFRADLFYRLNVVGFFLPPLRERPETVRHLAEQFLGEFAARAEAGARGMSADALRALTAYAWPGNIRELRNVIERAFVLSRGPEIHGADLPEAIRTVSAQPAPSAAPLPVPAPVPQAPRTLAQSKEEAEILLITEVLRQHGNNRLRAAAALGISRMGLYKKLHKYRLIDTA